MPGSTRWGQRSAQASAARAPEWAHILLRGLRDASPRELRHAEETLLWLLRQVRDLLADSADQHPPEAAADAEAEAEADSDTAAPPAAAPDQSTPGAVPQESLDPASQHLVLLETLTEVQSDMLRHVGDMVSNVFPRSLPTNSKGWSRSAAGSTELNSHLRTWTSWPS